MAIRGKKKLQPARKDKSAKPVQERKPRRAVDHSIEEWQIRVWKKGVPEVTAMLAKVLAYTAEDYWTFLDLHRQRAFVGLSRFSMEQWEALYREPVLAAASAWRMSSRELGILRPIAILLRRFLRQWNRLNPEERIAWLLSVLPDAGPLVKESELLIEAARKELQADLFTPPAGDSRHDKLIPNPEIQFFTTVWLPAMLVRGVSPAELFQRAELGELKAVCELIRLDPFAPDLPAIVRVRHEWLRDNRAPELGAVDLARRESMDLPPHRGAFKVGFAAWSIRCSREWCKIVGDDRAGLDKRDMWNLFDLVARERGRGNDSRDLQSFEGFQRAVSRHKLGLAIEGWDIFLR